MQYVNAKDHLYMSVISKIISWTNLILNSFNAITGTFTNFFLQNILVVDSQNDVNIKESLEQYHRNLKLIGMSNVGQKTFNSSMTRIF